MRWRTAETSVPLRGDLVALEEDAALLDRLEEVHAAKEGALPAAARADDDEHLAVRDAQVDPVEDVVVAEALVHAFEADHRRSVRAGPIRAGAQLSMPAALPPGDHET